jgi:hypothetical protein
MVVCATAIPRTLERIVNAQTGKGSNLASVPVEAQTDPLFHYRRSSFSPYLNSVFAVSNGPIYLEITLSEISNTGISNTAISNTGISNTATPKSVKSKRSVTTDVVQEDRFALLFRGPLELPLRQDVYNVSHAALGDFRLLLVPVLTRMNDARYYEAVINRVLR